MSDTTIDKIEWGKLLIPSIQLMGDVETVEEAREWVEGTNGTWFGSGGAFWYVEIAEDATCKSCIRLALKHLIEEKLK